MMPATRKNRTLFGALAMSIELVYHSVVRDIRKQSGNATLGLLVVMMQSLVMLAAFALLYTVLGARTFAIRGDFVLFLLTGIFLFLTHNSAISRVMGGSGPADPMNLHAPMNTWINLVASSLSGLYLNFLSIAIILTIVGILRGHLEIYRPFHLIFPFFMAWASGVAIGMLFLVATPFAPRFVPIIAQLYRRANMLTSGKMLPANYMSAGMVKWFDWNPLFHTIDQSRGEAFINYFPHRSNMEYPVIFTISAITFALIVESWLRKNMSVSWGKTTKL